ncbi:hypothetical protein CK203_066238 [Vitis vinifera]|uniref:Uncharacterized protein n=1 Tax=Vitis vinifera TaxID=29760 RepID=A0A438G8H4_VITVI|nr:hypothetical protein CK203_066238 [Vitis vinifera]
MRRHAIRLHSIRIPQEGYAPPCYPTLVNITLRMIAYPIRLCCPDHLLSSLSNGVSGRPVLTSLPWIPKELSLISDCFDLIFYGVFLVDENNKYTIILSIRSSFRSFRHILMKESILPYKDKLEYFLQPSIEYNYIPIEDWRKLVANKLSSKFQIK